MAGYFGLNLEQMVSRDYAHTQQVSAQVFSMAGVGVARRFDGVIYPSRNNYPGKAVALFHSAAKKVKIFGDIDLVDHADWPGFVDQYGIGVEPLT